MADLNYAYTVHPFSVFILFILLCYHPLLIIFVKLTTFDIVSINQNIAITVLGRL